MMRSRWFELRRCARVRLSLLLVSLCVINFAWPITASIAAVIHFNDNFTVEDDGPDPPLLGHLPETGGAWAQTGSSVVNPILIDNVMFAGDSATLVDTGQDAYAPFAIAASNNGATRMVTSTSIVVSAAAAAGDYFTHLSDPVGTTTNFYQRLFIRSADNGFQLGLAETGGGGAVATYGTQVLPFGVRHNIAIVWDFVDGPLNDVFRVAVGGPTYLTKTWTSTNAEPAQITAANLRQGTAGNAPFVKVDDLSVVSEEDPIVPEPTALSLGAVALLGLLSVRRSCAVRSLA